MGASPSVDDQRRIAVANINTGGRFENCFEFVLRDAHWLERYDRMITIFDREVPPELGHPAGTTWRTLYNAFDLELDNKIFGRPNVLKGVAEWYPTDVGVWLLDWNGRCLTAGADPALKVHRDLREFDLFCQAAAASAFATLEDFSEFEERYAHVARSRMGLERTKLESKLSKLLRPLMRLRIEFIAIEEAFNEAPFPADGGDDDASRIIHKVVEMIVGLGKGEYSALYRRDTEIVLLWRDVAAPRIIELPATANCWVVPDAERPTEGRLEKIDIPHSALDDDDAPAPATPTTPAGGPPAPAKKAKDPKKAKAAKAATKAMAVTRLKTISLHLGNFVVFAIHAKEHKGCAPLLVRYLDELSRKAGRKPTVFLSDTNVEKTEDCLEFNSELEKFNMRDASCGAPTTFKERTVFQGQPAKATIPARIKILAAAAAARQSSGPPSTAAGGDDMDHKGEGPATAEDTGAKNSFVFAPKDRVIAHSCDIVASRLEPPPPKKIDSANIFDSATFEKLRGDIDAPRLPSELWPSDHLAVLAEIIVPNVRDAPVAFLSKNRPNRPTHLDDCTTNVILPLECRSSSNDLGDRPEAAPPTTPDDEDDDNDDAKHAPPQEEGSSPSPSSSTSSSMAPTPSPPKKERTTHDDDTSAAHVPPEPAPDRALTATPPAAKSRSQEQLLAVAKKTSPEKIKMDSCPPARPAALSPQKPSPSSRSSS